MKQGYLKRGVNDRGRVANDVETEQIVIDEEVRSYRGKMTSVVQMRGSISLFWSKEASRFSPKPDIILQRYDPTYQATQLHFEDLANRYGNPIIVLNLIKTVEKRPREMMLRREFTNAVGYLNQILPEERHLKFIHWDFHKFAKSKSANVLGVLGSVASQALDLTGFYYSGKPKIVKGKSSRFTRTNTNRDSSAGEFRASSGDLARLVSNDILNATANHDRGKDTVQQACKDDGPRFQSGVLRTNCIDCLDRTNVAQYAYGLAALGHQLHALGFVSIPKIDINAPLADILMRFYETMGDTLALQYGGSAAHNKIFSERRGQWKAATQSQEFFRTLQRYYSNAYMDAEKQNAINLFLGDFQPQQGKPELWELGSDQHYDVARRGKGFDSEHAWSFMKRSLSDVNILRRSSLPVSRGNMVYKRLPKSATADRTHQEGDGGVLSNSITKITCENDISYSRCTPMMPQRQIFAESEHNYFSTLGFDETTSSNFLDLDWLSSSSNSCEEETFDRSTVTNSSIGSLSTENVINDITAATSAPPSENGSGVKGKDIAGIHSSTGDAAQSSANLSEFSDLFICWVDNGGTLCY